MLNCVSSIFEGSKNVVPAVSENASLLICVTPSGLEPGPILLRVTNNIDVWTNALEFVLDVPPTLLGIVPNRGTVLGNTRITLLGTGFPRSKEGTCLFGMITHVPAIWQTSESVTCITPPATAATIATNKINKINGISGSSTNKISGVSGISGSSTTVQYVPNGIDVVSPFSSSSLIFTYDAEIKLSTIWPPSGSSDGGTLVSLHGLNFRSSTHVACRFGNADVKGTYISPTTMQCLSPSIKEAGSSNNEGIHATGVVVLRVSTNGVDFSRDGLRFQYTEILHVVSISPRGGHVHGGTEVEIETKNMRRGPYALCRFRIVAEEEDQSSITSRTTLLKSSVSTSASASSSSALPSLRLGSIVNATYEGRNLLKCYAPPLSKRNIERNVYVTLEISTNGQDFTEDGTCSKLKMKLLLIVSL